jgi:hypothetical protein
MSRKIIAIAVFCLLLAALASWNTSYYRTPKIITADGDELTVCTGIMSVTSEGSPPTYSITYTDQGGAHVHLYGIHKLKIVDTRQIGPPAACHQ